MSHPGNNDPTTAVAWRPRAAARKATLLASLLLAAGCDSDCGLTSTIPGYTPECDSALVLYPEESLLEVDEVIEAWLPADPTPNTAYGATSGNPLTLLINGELANSHGTKVVFGHSLSEVVIEANIDAGSISGSLNPPLLDLRNE